MFQRLCAILVIFVFAGFGWLILGTSLSFRTNESDAKLRSNVASTWGVPQQQCQPKVLLDRINKDSSGGPIHEPVFLAADATKLDVTLALEHRQKGLLWYSTYRVNFIGSYRFHNPDQELRWITFQLPFPAQQAVYDGLTIQADGSPVPFTSDKTGALCTALLSPGGTVTIKTSYRSQGLENWRYKFGNDVTETRNFQLVMHTNFSAIDFPSNTLSPISKVSTGNGWELTWRYANLISGYEIGMTMPQKLQPGPLAADICRFAPLSLLLFFFVMFMLTTLRNIDLHPMNYFFLAAAFFAFHLLLAYLVDHLSLALSFWIASVVSVGLLVSYLRLVVGSQFALVEAGGAQLLYLFLFSLTFFWPGFTGLAITIGCIATLFVAMQLTARLRWSQLFAAPPARSL